MAVAVGRGPVRPDGEKGGSTMVEGSVFGAWMCVVVFLQLVVSICVLKLRLP